MSETAALSEPERRAAFLLRLRAAGVRDLAVLRAMESVPRSAFFPGVDPDVATRDIVLPLPGGEAAERPCALARCLEALAIRPGQRVLEVGTGSGYVTALLVKMGAVVTSLERRLSLLEAARLRLLALDLMPDTLGCADALAEMPPPRSVGCMLLHVAIPEPPAGALEALQPEGRLLYTTLSPRRLALLRLGHRGPETADLGASTAMPALPGLAP